MNAIGTESALTLAEAARDACIKELTGVPYEMLDSKTINELVKLEKAVVVLKRTWNPLEVAMLAGGLFVTYVGNNVAEADVRKLILNAYNGFLADTKENVDKGDRFRRNQSRRDLERRYLELRAAMAAASGPPLENHPKRRTT